MEPTTSLGEISRMQACALCGAECDGTKGIVYIGHACEPCVERWRNNETVVRDLDAGTARWAVDEVTA